MPAFASVIGAMEPGKDERVGLAFMQEAMRVVGDPTSSFFVDDTLFGALGDMLNVAVLRLDFHKAIREANTLAKASLKAAGGSPIPGDTLRI